MSEELKANFERPDLYSELAEALGCDPMDSHQGRLNRAARARAALAHPAPAGYALVPIEPTPEMLSHAMKECSGIGGGSCGEHVGVDRDDLRSVWEAMIAAAPNAQEPA